MAFLTNKNGLPQPIVDALKYDTYKVHGNISVTTLIDAPQIRILKYKHRHEISEDVSDMLWALMGTVVHSILERSHIKDSRKRAFLTVIETIKDEMPKFSENDQQALQELANKLIKLMMKFFPELEERYMWETALIYDYKGKLLYGTFDLYDKVEKCLYDYKVCSVYAYMYPESRKKWGAQTNTYAFMLRETLKLEVNEIRIVAIFRDWSASKKEFAKGDYPANQFMTLPIVVVDHEKMRKYIHGRLDLHAEADNGNIPECSGTERWATASEFHVRRKGLKRSVRKFVTEVEAKEFIKDNQHKHPTPLKIEENIGESKRCESYCPVKEFCPQKAAMDKRVAELFE